MKGLGTAISATAIILLLSSLAGAQSANTISLVPGWNLISLPMEQPADAAISSVLSGITGLYDIVWAYPGQAWNFYDPINTSGNSLTTMQAGLGYWINITAETPQTLSVSGVAPSSSLPLLNGWNLVGYNGISCAAASKALSSLGSAVEVSWGYPNQSWKVYDPNDPAGSTLTQLCPNNGYWIKVNQKEAWKVSSLQTTWDSSTWDNCLWEP